MLFTFKRSESPIKNTLKRKLHNFTRTCSRIKASPKYSKKIIYLPIKPKNLKRWSRRLQKIQSTFCETLLNNSCRVIESGLVLLAISQLLGGKGGKGPTVCTSILHTTVPFLHSPSLFTLLSAPSTLLPKNSVKDTAKTQLGGGLGGEKNHQQRWKTEWKGCHPKVEAPPLPTAIWWRGGSCAPPTKKRGVFFGLL